LIEFVNTNSAEPYVRLRKIYKKALNSNQKAIEAISISSYSNKAKSVDSRFVNLKIVDNTDFIFFSNYNSPKAEQFQDSNKIAALIFWNEINVQIRIKAHIKKTNEKFNNSYFYSRDLKKNALAISSDQSQKIESYDAVRNNYQEVLKSKNLKNCPKYWGGFSFKPYYFEFWEGNKNRINKREVYVNTNGCWKHSFLQP